MYRVFALSCFATALLCGLSRPCDGRELRLVEDLVLGEDEQSTALGKIRDVAIGADGTIYVLDAGFEVVRRFTEDGEFLGDVGRSGEGPGEFINPMKIALSTNGNIYIAGHSGTITELTSTGNPVRLIKRKYIEPPRDLAVDSSGAIYLSALDIVSQKVVHKYDSISGEHLLSFADSYAMGTGIDTRQEQVEGGGLIAADGGEIIYLQLNPQELQFYGEDGLLRTAIPARGSQSVRTDPAKPDFRGLRLKLPETASLSLVPLTESRVLTVLGVDVTTTPSSYIDVYDRRTGELVATTTVDWLFRAYAADSKGRIYVQDVTGDVPLVRRYRLEYD